ncbi:hypothetical protein FZEAL_7982 [Fusarium zealandicum]|uniref:Putative gamma-glutamylcyclotransferase n=1 Tax=Fusarium zealandicum TaxID=1053134 RepID=A0A8H4UEY3_9HYPO|nr:hypothetical protein FZEAL_7982 [Fusarium zealandicum]
MSGENTAFFYGTLMAPEVFFSVVYGDKNPPQAIKDLHTFSPAILEGYCRRKIQYADYPAVVQEKGHTVLGVYATGLTDANVEKLDTFEGGDYDKEKVHVKLLEKDGKPTTHGEHKEAFVYVFLHREDTLEEEWDFEDFRKTKMQSWTRGSWAYDPDLAAQAVEDSWN